MNTIQVFQLSAFLGEELLLDGIEIESIGGSSFKKLSGLAALDLPVALTHSVYMFRAPAAATDSTQRVHALKFESIIYKFRYHQ